jgi:hypothetical protein
VRNLALAVAVGIGALLVGGPVTAVVAVALVAPSVAALAPAATRARLRRA